MPMSRVARNYTVVLSGLILILGVGLWYIGHTWYQNYRAKQTEQALETTDAVDMTELKFLTAKEVLARLDRKETLLLIDVRPKESYDAEHIVDSVSEPASTLNAFTPNKGQVVIIISGPEVSNTTLKGIHLLFKKNGYQFAFLQGTITDWRLAGGTTLSSGDPESGIDYAKVIFIEPDQVLPLSTTLVTPLFLDVRSNEDFQRSHLPSALNIPLDTLERQREDIPRQKSIFVYGSNDFESYQGGVRLFDLGFFGVRVIRNGFMGWQEKKLPVETTH